MQNSKFINIKKKVESAIYITFNGFSVIKMIDDF